LFPWYWRKTGKAAVGFMPCDDLTESIWIVIDAQERIATYCLRKAACAGAVGEESLLLDRLRGYTVTDILQLDIPGWCGSFRFSDDLDRFLTLKHLFALRAALEAFVGMQPGGPTSRCAVAAVGHDGENTLISAELKMPVLSAIIEGCVCCSNRPSAEAFENGP
jgi:hypothetical protein